MSKIFFKFYGLFVDLLFYEFCPKSMQTVSLVQRILDRASKVYLYDNDSKTIIKIKRKAYKQAINYIECLFDIEIPYSRMINNLDFDFNSLVLFLRDYSRNNKVKSHFDI